MIVSHVPYKSCIGEINTVAQHVPFVRERNGRSTAQAGPCLAGVFQPLKCKEQQAISNKQHVVMGWKMFLPYKWPLWCRPVRTINRMQLVGGMRLRPAKAFSLVLSFLPKRKYSDQQQAGSRQNTS